MAEEKKSALDAFNEKVSAQVSQNQATIDKVDTRPSYQKQMEDASAKRAEASAKSNDAFKAEMSGSEEKPTETAPYWFERIKKAEGNEEDQKKQEKRDRAKRTIAQIADAFGAVGNVVGTMVGGQNIKQHSMYKNEINTQQARLDRRRDELKELYARHAAALNSDNAALMRYTKQQYDKKKALFDAEQKRIENDYTAAKDGAMFSYRAYNDEQNRAQNERHHADNIQVQKDRIIQSGINTAMRSSGGAGVAGNSSTIKEDIYDIGGAEYRVPKDYIKRNQSFINSLMAQDGIKRPEDDNGRLLGSEQAFVLANWTKSALAVKYMDKYRISDKKPSMPKTEKEKTFDKLKGSLKGIKSIVGGGKSTIDFTPDGDSENDDLENDLD